MQILGQIWADILKRPYITIGMLGFLCMVPLAITSNNLSVRKLGPTWRRLHKLTYVAVLLGAVHFLMLVKGFQIEPMIYLGVSSACFWLCVTGPTGRRRPPEAGIRRETGTRFCSGGRLNRGPGCGDSVDNRPTTRRAAAIRGNFLSSWRILVKSKSC